MSIQLLEAWKINMSRAIFNGEPIDFTSTTKLAIQYIITNMTRANRPFKLHTLGAGVQRITSDTTTCPCCKRSIS